VPQGRMGVLDDFEAQGASAGVGRLGWVRSAEL
jgi:hypothetical protein